MSVSKTTRTGVGGRGAAGRCGRQDEGTERRQRRRGDHLPPRGGRSPAVPRAVGSSRSPHLFHLSFAVRIGARLRLRPDPGDVRPYADVQHNCIMTEKGKSSRERRAASPEGRAVSAERPAAGPQRPAASPQRPAASSRRAFVKSVAAGSALAAGMPSLVSGEVAPDRPGSAGGTPGKGAGTARRTMSRPTPPTTRVAPSDRIGLAVIGAGGMGMADVNTALRIPGVELVAACDVFDGRLVAARERHGDIFTTRDYREVLARDDIDAVIVGTPDHWHQPISVDALRAGKAVYCEKPMVHDIAEGHDLIRAQDESGRVFMVGSQGMSSLGNEKAKELYEDGAIGQLNYAEGFWARNDPIGAWQYPIPADASEDTVDWQRFLGPAPDRPYDPLRIFRWRNYRGLRHGGRRRPLRAPLLQPPLRRQLTRAHAHPGRGRTPLLEGRPRSPRRAPRRLRLPRDRRASRLQPVAPRQLRGRHFRQHLPAPGRERRRNGRDLD